MARLDRRQLVRPYEEWFLIIHSQVGKYVEWAKGEDILDLDSIWDTVRRGMAPAENVHSDIRQACVEIIRA